MGPFPGFKILSEDTVSIRSFDQKLFYKNKFFANLIHFFCKTLGQNVDTLFGFRGCSRLVSHETENQPWCFSFIIL